MNPLRLDPTRTTMLRRQYMAEIRRRFNIIKKLVVEAVGQLDVLGLDTRRPVVLSQLVVHQLLERQAWRFKTDAQKLDSFNSWIQEQVDANILNVDVKDDPWTAKYVGSAYKQGSMRAYTDARRSELMDTPDFYRGRRSQFLESAFNQPERMSKLQLLYTRSYEDLKGISAAMSQQMSRTLADGLAHGLGPAAIARNLSDNIDGITRQRAEVMARTEVIAAHAEGQLDSFTELGVEEVGLQAEWSTAGDDRVCELCDDLEGVIMTVDEARGLIPRHPNCRCSWLPADPELKEGKQFWTKGEKQERLEASLMDELPIKTREGEKVPQTPAEARMRSTWAGKDLLRKGGLAPTPAAPPAPVLTIPPMLKPPVKPVVPSVPSPVVPKPPAPAPVGPKITVVKPKPTSAPTLVEPKWHNLDFEDRKKYYNPEIFKKIDVWDFDENKWRHFDSMEDFKKWWEQVWFAPMSGPAAEEKLWYRFGAPPDSFRSFNYSAGRAENGVSVYATPKGSGGAVFFADRPLYSGLGRQVGWGSDGEPLIIPTGKWGVVKSKAVKPKPVPAPEIVPAPVPKPIPAPAPTPVPAPAPELAPDTFGNLSTAERTTLAPAEKKIVSESVEHGIAVDRNGAVVVDRIGEEHQIVFTREEVIKMRGAILTHNHSSNVGFSAEDMNMLISNGLKEIRAVTSAGVYRAEMSEALSQLDIFERRAIGSKLRTTIKQGYNRIEKRITKQVDAIAIPVRMPWEEANKIFKAKYTPAIHEYFMKNAEKWGLKYTLEPVATAVPI